MGEENRGVTLYYRGELLDLHHAICDICIEYQDRVVMNLRENPDETFITINLGQDIEATRTGLECLLANAGNSLCRKIGKPLGYVQSNLADAVITRMNYAPAYEEIEAGCLSPIK